MTEFEKLKKEYETTLTEAKANNCGELIPLITELYIKALEEIISTYSK